MLGCVWGWWLRGRGLKGASGGAGGKDVMESMWKKSRGRTISWEERSRQREAGRIEESAVEQRVWARIGYKNSHEDDTRKPITLYTNLREMTKWMKKQTDTGMTGGGVRVSVLAAIPSLPVPSPFCFSSCSPSSRHQLSPIHLSLGTALLLLVPSAPWFSLQFCPQWETHLASHGDAECFGFPGSLRYHPVILETI